MDRIDRIAEELRAIQSSIDALAGDGDPQLRKSAADVVRSATALRGALAAHIDWEFARHAAFLDRLRVLSVPASASTSSRVVRPADEATTVLRLPAQRPAPDAPAEALVTQKPAGKKATKKAVGRRKATKSRRWRGFVFRYEGPAPERYRDTWSLTPSERWRRQNEQLAMLSPEIGGRVTLPNGSVTVTLRRLTREERARAELGRKALDKAAATK